MPIKSGDRVVATFGITYFKSAVRQNPRGTTRIDPMHSTNAAALPPQSVDRAALIATLRATVARIEAKLQS